MDTNQFEAKTTKLRTHDARWAVRAQNDGFTLIELMITVSILAILLALAVPGMTELIRDSRVSKLTNEFSSGLSYARGEAVNKNVCVTMCLSDNPAAAAPNCSTTATNWGAGWIVFANPDCNASALNAGDSLLQVYEGDLNGPQLFGVTAIRRITFTSRGVPTGVASARALTVNSNSIPVKTVCLDAAGRARVGNYDQAGFCQ
jgi:type IV fimbrial biogenesis protein FimT